MLTVGRWADVFHILICFLGEASCLLPTKDLLDEASSQVSESPWERHTGPKALRSHRGLPKLEQNINMFIRWVSRWHSTFPTCIPGGEGLRPPRQIQVNVISDSEYWVYFSFHWADLFKVAGFKQSIMQNKTNVKTLHLNRLLRWVGSVLLLKCSSCGDWESCISRNHGYIIH